MARPRLPYDVTRKQRGNRPLTVTLSVSSDELSALYLLAAIHGYGAPVPFLRRLFLDCALAHHVDVGATDYPLPPIMSREESLRRAAASGTYTPAPDWWRDLLGLGASRLG